MLFFIKTEASKFILKRSAQANPIIKDRYSLQFENDQKNCLKPVPTGTAWERVDVELESIKLLDEEEAS